MSRFLARTRLGAAIREVCEERAKLRRKEHRYALKLKRTAVRMQVLAQVKRAEIVEVSIAYCACTTERP